MIRLKNILNILFLFALLTGGAYFYYDKEIAPCRNPISYDIGSFDSRFGISKEGFLNTIVEAESVWEGTVKRDLFKYVPGSKFKINLVFDERQKSTIEATKSKEEIGSTREQYNSLLIQYKALTSSYERELSLYNNKVASFETRLNSYNKEVAETNSRGGATPKEFKDLENEKKYLESQKIVLDRERVLLNGRASELNLLGDSINSLARKLNITVNVHNERFGEAREFDQGDYRGDMINIYQFNGIGDLRLVMAHELGHALGIDHVENPESIMYYLMDEQNIQEPTPSLEDLIAVTDSCNF